MRDKMLRERIMQGVWRSDGSGTAYSRDLGLKVKLLTSERASILIPCCYYYIQPREVAKREYIMAIWVFSLQKYSSLTLLC